MVTGKTEDVHVTRLKAFEYEPGLVDPLKLAAADYKEFVIQRPKTQIVAGLTREVGRL